MKLDHINLTVTHLDTTMDWYQRVFGFSAVEQGIMNGRRWAIICADDAMLALYEVGDRRVPEPAELARQGLHAMAHFGLRLRDRARWLQTLTRENLAAEHLRYPRSDSWYVLDPNGWEIEVSVWDESAAHPGDETTTTSALASRLEGGSA